MRSLYLRANMRIGLLREEKIPADTRVPLTPTQCAAIVSSHPGVSIVAQPSLHRCYSDAEFEAAGIPLREDLSDCDILLGVKEVPPSLLIPGKTYLFFSHTRKAQPYNKLLMQALLRNEIRMIDYECLTHADGNRILGFGYYAGIVGAHNGLMNWGRKTGLFNLPRAYYLGTFDALKSAYSELVLPPVKIVITGAGNVAAGVLEIMHLLDIEYVEPQDFLESTYDYPVYTHLKGHTLYVRKDDKTYHRNDFHARPGEYFSLFPPFLHSADILMNGVYWDIRIPRLFAKEDLLVDPLRTAVMADITCDVDGSVVINQGASTIEVPVYGVHRRTLHRTEPYLQDLDVVDIMAVDNLPNELPRDASQYFGEHLHKYILSDLLIGESAVLDRATICRDGHLSAEYSYLAEYAAG